MARKIRLDPRNYPGVSYKDICKNYGYKTPLLSSWYLCTDRFQCGYDCPKYRTVDKKDLRLALMNARIKLLEIEVYKLKKCVDTNICRIEKLEEYNDGA